MSRHLSIEPDPFPTRATDRARLHVRIAALTDRGLERQNNEDSAAFADLADDATFEPPASTALSLRTNSPMLALVCDGMGGEAGGEVASRLAIDTIVPSMRRHMRQLRDEGATPGEWQVARGLVASVEAASERIRAEARRQPQLARMGTTATVAAVIGRSLVCAQVGDSRAYLLRNGSLTQLTHDQTMAELLRSSGTPIENIHEIVGAHVILQAVGSSSRLEVAITHTALLDGDTVLLCSDGLSGVVPDAILRATLDATDDPARACAELVKRAIEAGAPDNVTCVVFRVRLGER